ncbi:MAG: hypothetical protein Pyrs2KO_17290 [Pyruvatibacter sp.]
MWVFQTACDSPFGCIACVRMSGKEIDAGTLWCNVVGAALSADEEACFHASSQAGGSGGFGQATNQ